MLAPSSFEAAAKLFSRKVFKGRIPKENLWGMKGVCEGCPFKEECPHYSQLFEWVPVYPGFDAGPFSGNTYDQVRMYEKCPII